MAIKIENGINIPSKGKRGRKQKYPITEMKIGDSFFVDVQENDVSKTQRSISACALTRLKRLGLNYKITTRIQTNPPGVRVWRIA